ncbi:amidohydrolase family protein [bacterium]|nr:amidohydrolase family protein [bacterium]
MEIVDVHHHLWDIERNFYPWLKEADHDRGWGDMSDLMRSYRPADLIADAAEAGVTLMKSVHVQANFDPADPIGETRWLDEIAGEPQSCSLPSAIVGFADLSAPNLLTVLEGHTRFSRVRGVRQVLNRHPDPRLNRAPRDFLEDGNWRNGFAKLARFGLVFDAQIYHHQGAGLAELARRHPEIPVVLDHAGMPVQRDPDNLEGWRRAITELATVPNITVKISGFGMVDNTWTTDSIRPFVRHCIECFGPERSMFGSNFPVDRLMATYGRIWNSYADITSDLSESERHSLFRGTAERIYRI